MNLKYSEIVNLTKRDIKGLDSDQLFNLHNKLKVNYFTIIDYLKRDDGTVMPLTSWTAMIRFVKDLLNNIDKEPSRVYMLKLPKIRSYNELFDLILAKGKKVVQYNDLYLEYTAQILNGLEKIDSQGEIKDYLQSRFLKINIEFFVNYTQKDTDNISKPFYDALCKYGNTSDNKLKSITSFKSFKNNESNDEYILFTIEQITVDEIENSILRNDYIKQQIKLSNMI